MRLGNSDEDDVFMCCCSIVVWIFIVRLMNDDEG